MSKTKKTIRERFEEFDQDNPDVWELFKQFTFELINAGREYYSVDAVVHRIRWETAVQTESKDEYKINDHFTAHYARKFHDEFPKHTGFFRTRPLRTA